jgi:hypothetical protein
MFSDVKAFVKRSPLHLHIREQNIVQFLSFRTVSESPSWRERDRMGDGDRNQEAHLTL